MPEETRQNRKLLFVEDEPFIGELYVRALHKAGYEVSLVADGKEAYEQAKTGQYDIILLDLMLPTVLGMDILRRLRQEVPDLKSRIIIVTNLEQTGDQRAEIEKLADGYLIKAEITPRQLLVFLAKIK